MNSRQPPKDGCRFDLNMAGEGYTVRQDHMIVDDTVVGDMRVSHEEVVVADACHAATFCRASIQSGEFPDPITIADFQISLLAGILQILWRSPDGGELEDLVVATNFSPALYDNVTGNHSPGTNDNMFADHAVRPDSDIFGEPGAGMDNCG
jgi:hypothetical protein